MSRGEHSGEPWSCSLCALQAPSSPGQGGLSAALGTAMLGAEGGM